MNKSLVFDEVFLINIIFKRCSSGENLVLQLFCLLQSEDFFGIVSNDHIARQQRENIEYIVKMKRQMSSWCTNKTSYENVLLDKTSYEKRFIGQNVLRKTSYWTKRPTKNVLLDKTSHR